MLANRREESLGEWMVGMFEGKLKLGIEAHTWRGRSVGGYNQRIKNSFQK
jgi:hypothetical protein